MSRYFAPVVFLAATAWMIWHNQQGGDLLIVPFVDLMFPATARDRALMAERSAQVMSGITVVLFIWTFIEHLRDLRRTSR